MKKILMLFFISPLVLQASFINIFADRNLFVSDEDLTYSIVEENTTNFEEKEYNIKKNDMENRNVERIYERVVIFENKEMQDKVSDSQDNIESSDEEIQKNKVEVDISKIVKSISKPLIVEVDKNKIINSRNEVNIDKNKIIKSEKENKKNNKNQIIAKKVDDVNNAVLKTKLEKNPEDDLQFNETEEKIIDYIAGKVFENKDQIKKKTIEAINKLKDKGINYTPKEFLAKAYENIEKTNANSFILAVARVINNAERGKK